MVKRNYSINHVRTRLLEKKLYPYFTSYSKINSKCSKDINIKESPITGLLIVAKDWKQPEGPLMIK